MNAFSASLRTITSAFEQLHIRYLIGGSPASSARGVLRATLAVDVLASFQDLGYARRWAERLGVSGLLERGLEQADK